MSPSTYYLEDGRHLARLHRRRCRRHAYAPTSNTASHDNHQKINSWVSFSFPYMGVGLCLFGPPELRYKSLVGCNGLTQSLHHVLVMRTSSSQ